jgi:hypothetical protein
MEIEGWDIPSIAMVGGFFAAGFAAVWIFLTLRQGEKATQGKSKDDRR